jgi:hypothetical protein
VTCRCCRPQWGQTASGISVDTGGSAAAELCTWSKWRPRMSTATVPAELVFATSVHLGHRNIY